jgi:hypothetical protein
MTAQLNPDLVGWWRIVETSQWTDEHLNDLGPALISITGRDDRLRMLCLLAHVDFTPTQTGASFTWRGAWEFDQMTGRGSVRLGRDGKIHGTFSIDQGDKSTFIAERTSAPAEPIADPPAYRHKWARRRRW